MSTSAPVNFACLDIDAHRVYVMVGGTEVCSCPEEHRTEFISIGVRDNDSEDVDISRDEYRELINVTPVEAIHLARYLLDYATDMLDSSDDDEDDPEA